MNKCFFITGTDTDVGKTISTCALLQAANCAGYRAVGYKPVASGCKLTSSGPRNSDALALMTNSNVALSYHQVNPLAFIEPIPLHIASRNDGKPITLTALSTGLKILENVSEWVFIEGSGGWFSPLGERISYSDWVISENLPVILVVGIKLGCINHALLTSLAIQQARLPLVGWIANHPISTIYPSQDYILTLKKRLCVPFLGEIPWMKVIDNSIVKKYVNFSLLESYFF